MALVAGSIGGSAVNDVHVVEFYRSPAATQPTQQKIA
jgi:hypothetical protein